MPYQYDETAIIRAAADTVDSAHDLPHDAGQRVVVSRAAFETLEAAVRRYAASTAGRSWVDINGPDLTRREFFALVKDTP